MEEIRGPRLFLYNLSSAGHSIFMNIFSFSYAIFLLPPAEKIAEGMKQYISGEAFFGIFTVLGIIMIVSRFIDGFADPFIGYFSDRSRSRLGRRRVFMLFGAFPLAISTVLMFFPPFPHASILNAIYFTVIFSINFFSYTAYVAPYIALIPELSPTEEKRVTITTVQGYCVLIGAVIVMIGGPLLLKIGQSFGTPTDAYRFMAIIVSAIGFVFLMLAVFAVDEKRFSTASRSETGFFASVGIVLRNRVFLVFMLGNMAFWFIFNTIQSSLNHVVVTLVKTDESNAFIFNVCIFAAAALFFMLVWKLSRTIGKKKVMMMGLAGFVVVGILLSLIGLTGVPPFIWAVVAFILAGFPVAVFIVIPNVFISEICDRDFEATGSRREAMYFGVHGFFQTITMGISTFILSFFYSVFGKDVANPLGVRLTLVCAAVLALAGLAIIGRYPEKARPANARS